MRTLIVSHAHPDYSIGGAEVASHTLFRALDALPGQEAFYLSRAPANFQRHAATPLMSLRHGGRETFLHTGEWDEFWLSNRTATEMAGPLASYLQLLDPDVVHFHHVIGLGVEALALVKRAVPRARIVITFHEYLAICANHGQMIKAGRRALCRQSSPAECNACFPQRSTADFFAREEHLRHHLMLADVFVSPSHFLRERYVAWGLPAERFHVIENAVAEIPRPARPLGPAGRRDRFAYFGQISEFKGLHVVLEAISLIPEQLWAGATLSVFGGNLEFQPPAFRERFEALMTAAGRRARFYGSYRQDELAGLISDVDWVIMPSIWWENSPVVIQEAFLHRRPLMVSGIGGMAEKVADRVDGLHFRVGSPESLAERMTEALTDQTLWPHLAAATPTPLSPRDFAAAHLAAYQSTAPSVSDPAQLLRVA